MNPLDTAISQLESLTKILKRKTFPQVRSADEKAIIKATAFSWFQKIRGETTLTDALLAEPDAYFKFLLEAGEKHTTRRVYLNKLKSLRMNLIKVRSDNIVSLSNPNQKTPDAPPDFSSLIKDNKMKDILVNRWEECIKCNQADAPLACLVMMGGILEAILLARINSTPNKAQIFKAKTAPIDKKTSKTLPLQEWTLRNYIDVARELGWISQSTKDVGEVLRDYRNYVHPYKEFSHGIKLHKTDAELFWQITKSIISQILQVK
jgi:hypothetical protein